MSLLNGRVRTFCRSESWRPALDSELLERAPELGQQRVDSPIDVERRREVQKARDLLRGEIVVETQTEEEQVLRTQRRKHLLECERQLGLSNRELRIGVDDHGDVIPLEAFGNQILQSSPNQAIFIRVGAALSAVSLPVEVEAESARDDNEPRRQLTARVSREFAQPSEIAGAKLLEDERIGIHCVVVARGHRTRDVQQ